MDTSPPLGPLIPLFCISSDISHFSCLFLNCFFGIFLFKDKVRIVNINGGLFFRVVVLVLLRPPISLAMKKRKNREVS